MNTPTWVPGLDILTGESPEDRLCRFVRTLNGVSLSNRVDVLKALVGRDVDPETLRAWQWQTNCATSALGVIAAACGSIEVAAALHALLGMTSKIGTSPTWLFAIGNALGVCFEYTNGRPIPKGALVAYANGDHFEWILSDMGADGIADHGGGGRANNAITVGRGDCRTSWGRKITHVFLFASKLPGSPEAATGELERVGKTDPPPALPTSGHGAADE